MMRILRVVSSMDPESGGVSQAIRSSIPALESLGIRSDVVSFDNPQDKFIQEANFTVHPIGPAKGPYSYCANLSGWMMQHLSLYDAVIIDGLWQHHSFGTVRALLNFQKKYGARPRLFVMPHGMLDPYFQRAKTRRLKAVRNFIFWKFIEHKVIDAADGVLFTCETELALARLPFRPYRPQKERSIGFGVLTPPSPNELQKNAFYQACPDVLGKPYLLFLGRIHPKKGVNMLLEAYGRLKKERPEVPDLVVAGPGRESKYGESLPSIGTPGIHFPGMLQGSAKWGAFYNCDCFVLPSHQENFGIAVVEALACSKPVLISDQVNIHREIVDGGGGFSEADTVEGTYLLLKRWTQLGADGKKLMQLKAQDVYKRHFAIESAAARMEVVLKETVVPKKESEAISYEIIS